MYGTQAQEWPHTHRARAAVEAAEEVAATAQVDQPVVGLAHMTSQMREMPKMVPVLSGGQWTPR